MKSDLCNPAALYFDYGIELIFGVSAWPV